MFLFVILLVSALSCYCQDYSLERDDNISEESSELFNVVFNMTSKERPDRLNNVFVNVSNNLLDPDASFTPEPATRRVLDCNKRQQQTEENDYPFSVSIQRKGAHYATGALIDKKWILTAAGAFYNVRESIKLYRALLGTVYCKRSGKAVPLRSIELHPSYEYKKPSFDLALLQMGAPVDYSNVIKPIALSNVKGKVVSAKFLTTYWPRVIVKGNILPKSAQERVKYNSMRVSTQLLVPWHSCADALRLFSEDLHNTSLCLKPIIKYHSPCMPDVGAPVLAEDGLWGITSGWAPAPCPEAPVPTVFTRVSLPIVKTWIYSLMLA